MHELAIAQSIFESLELRLAKHGYRSITAVGLRVGALTDVVAESLEFGFEIISQGTPFEATRLEIENVPIRGKCRGCSRDFEVESYQFVCPACENRDIALLQGDELEIAYLRVEPEEDPASKVE